MISVLPEGTLSAFPLIVFLCGAPCHQLDTPGDDLSSISVMNEKMYVVAGNHVVQDDESVTLLRLKQPMDPVESILTEFQQKLFFMTPMCDVPHITGNVMSTRSRHAFVLLLNTLFFAEKQAS
jgi:hypothetical protein